MKPLPFLHYDPQDAGPQYLEDLATGYWFSEALFTAVEMEVFTFLEPKGKTVEEIARSFDFNPRGLARFLQALCALGLLICDGGLYFNTRLASDYLVAGKENYQGDSILWRKYLAAGWQGLAKCLRAGGRVDFGSPEEDPARLKQRIRKYITAMDRVARGKVRELLPFFEGLALTGEILDVGAGSGAVAAGFLEGFPATRATLLDLPEVLDYTRELMRERGCAERVTCLPANILEEWPVGNEGFDLVILSNIVHAYAEDEISAILARAAACLKPGGLMLVHDFFLEHHPAKAALFDLNMFINTYNGKVFPAKWVGEALARLGLSMTGLIPLKTDTGVIFAAKDEKALAGLCPDATTLLAARILTMGFDQVRPVAMEVVHVPDWADLRCQFGCSGYGKKHCPPNSPAPEKTRAALKDYTRALLLAGEPPTGDFQRRVLQAEKEAFMAGFHKAFAYWAGPCAICDACAADGICHNTKNARPSMEGAGIDVFETVRRAGFELRTLDDKGDFARYFALLLLE